MKTHSLAKELSSHLPSLLCALTLCYFDLSAQGQCSPLVTNYRFRLEFCLKDYWTLEEQPPYVVISAGNQKISIYHELNTGNLTSEELWKKQYEKTKEYYQNHELLKFEKINVDTVEAYLGVSYHSSIDTPTEKQKEMFQTTVVFASKKQVYVMNNNCYSSDCVEAENFVRQLAASITFIPPQPTEISDEEKNKVQDLGQKLFIAFKNKDASQCYDLVVTKEELTQGFKLYIKDENMKARYMKNMDLLWEDYKNEFLDGIPFTFSELIEDGKKQRIKWSKIQFEKFLYTPKSNALGFTSGSADLLFQYRKRTYSIHLNDIMMLPEGWRIAEMKDRQVHTKLP